MSTQLALDPTKLALSDVAVTGLLTAFAHATESRRENALLDDPLAETIADRLAPLLADAPGRIARNLARGKLRDDLVVHLAMRAAKYDAFARGFSQRHPGCRVVNLGCGLDTRFWRVDDGRMRFYDLDLPEMIALKRDLVPENARYHLIDRSVLDHAWMDRIGPDAEAPCVFLAEGLFMYLPPDGARRLVLALADRYPGGELAFEIVNSRWLRRGLKWIIDVKLQKQLGLGRGTEFRFGIRDGHEVETWSPNIRLLEEWSYVDEDEPRIGPIRWFRHWDLLRYTQWTVRYALGPASDVRGAKPP